MALSDINSYRKRCERNFKLLWLVKGWSITNRNESLAFNCLKNPDYTLFCFSLYLTPTMRIYRVRKILNKAGMLIVLASPAFPSAEAGFYSWVDDKGNTYYADKIPPEHSRHRRNQLSKNIRVIDVTEAAKTKEQWDLERRLERLKKEQEKLIAKQKSDDRVLLSTFRSEEDMRMTLAGKLLAISAHQKVSKGNLQRLENQLQAQQKIAAGFERDGKKIPAEVLDDIQSIEQQIQLTMDEINQQIEQKRDVEKTFQADVERYIYLTRSKSERGKPIVNSSGAESDHALTGLYTCNNETQCHSAWQAARLFVQNHTTTGIDIESEKLIMSSDPKDDHDLSLSVSRVAKEKNRSQFFLDIRCRNSSQGRELCASPEVLNLRPAFKNYIESVMVQR